MTQQSEEPVLKPSAAPCPKCRMDRGWRIRCSTTSNLAGMLQIITLSCAACGDETVRRYPQPNALGRLINHIIETLGWAPNITPTARPNQPAARREPA